MLFDEKDSFEVQTAKAWSQKQHFDSLITYTEKLQYWITIFGCPPSHVNHIHRHFDAERNELFRFELPYPTENELRELRRTQLNGARYDCFREHRVVKTFGWEPHEENLSPEAFTVEPYASLVSSVEPKHGDKVYLNLEQDYLSTVLLKVTRSIDAAIRTKRGYSPTIRELVEDLRFSLMNYRQIVDPDEIIEVEENGDIFNLRNKEPYDLISLVKKDIHLQYMPDVKMYVLGEVWDIVHFENYLKVRLAEIKNDKYIVYSKPKEQNITEVPQLIREAELDQPKRALYWFYIHATRYAPGFEDHPKGKMAAIKELVGEASWKSFQQHYNAFVSPQSRRAPANIKRIEKILPLLIDYPGAYNMAIDEFRIARAKIDDR